MTSPSPGVKSVDDMEAVLVDSRDDGGERTVDVTRGSAVEGEGEYGERGRWIENGCDIRKSASIHYQLHEYKRCGMEGRLCDEG